MPAGLTPEREPRTLIGRVLINAGYVTLDQLAEALARQVTHPWKRVGTILVELGPYYSCPAGEGPGASGAGTGSENTTNGEL